MAAFNNCGQPGEIRFDQSAADQGSNDSIDSGDDNRDDSSLAIPVGPPVAPDKDPMLLKFEKVISSQETQNADILFVVDNSGSMANEQANMSARFPLFIEKLKQINWRVGVITTDVADSGFSYSDGKLQIFDNGQYYIDSKIPTMNAQNMFSKTIQRRESGSGYEQGIYATYRFLEQEKKRLVPFLRDNSSFNVVFISDADETPFLKNGEPFVQHRNKPEELVKYLQKTLPMKKFQFHSIVVRENDEACLSVSDNESYGISYESLARSTKGVMGSVCAPDYSGQLTFLSEKIKELIKSISLECEPALDPRTKKPFLEIQYVEENPIPIEIEKIQGKEVFLKGQYPSGQIKLKYFCQKQMDSI